jgi:hypothetical protein
VSEPPIGLKPQWLHIEQRIQEIIEAMARCADVKPVPAAWVAELRDLLQQQGKVQP